MTIGNALGLSDSQERAIARTLQLALIGLAVYGLATRQGGMALNGAFAPLQSRSSRRCSDESTGTRWIQGWSSG